MKRPRPRDANEPSTVELDEHDAHDPVLEVAAEPRPDSDSEAVDVYVSTLREIFDRLENQLVSIGQRVEDVAKRTELELRMYKEIESARSRADEPEGLALIMDVIHAVNRAATSGDDSAMVQSIV